MNRFAVAILLTAAIGFVAVNHAAQNAILPQAEAADVWKAALTSNDAGSTNTASITAGFDYAIQCATEACYKTGATTGLSADCTKDYVLPEEQGCNGAGTIQGILVVDAGYVATTTSTRGGATHCFFSRDFEAGGSKFIVARALDAGNPACRLYQRTKL